MNHTLIDIATKQIEARDEVIRRWRWTAVVLWATLLAAGVNVAADLFKSRAQERELEMLRFVHGVASEWWQEPSHESARALREAIMATTPAEGADQ